MNKLMSILIGAALLTFAASCGSGGDSDKSKPGIKKIEPAKPEMSERMVKSVDVPETIDEAMVEEGKTIYEANCTACHKIEKRFVGPALAGIADRREHTWIMNMILDPEFMVKNDEIARNLLMEFSAPMANQNLSKDEARKILEYFRTL